MDMSSPHPNAQPQQPGSQASSYRSSNSHLRNNHLDGGYNHQDPSSSAPRYDSPSQQQEQQDLAGNGRFTEEWDASQRGSSIIDGQRGTQSRTASAANMQRSNSVRSYAPGDDQQLSSTSLSRGNTLKKKNSLRHAGGGSLRRSSSRRSMRAGSVKSLQLQSASDPDEAHSAFFCPVPTTGNPTDVLANRFQTWRKVLKDLISYFREIQNHYENRTKSLVKVSNASNNISSPPNFLRSAGIDDALQFLRAHNKNAVAEANKAKEIEEDVILALTGLRSDLQQKIKEIKNLSGDFKNSVEKEMDMTSKAVRTLTDALGKNEVDSATTTGKQDPFLLRLAVDRQVERQLDEENYLHQAYLNLESSGRELESIVIGEIQKAYNAYAGILKREADNAYSTIEELRDGPISMPKDQEWIHFVTHDEQFLDPTIPLRSAEQIHYPGQDHLSAQEIRAGLLERKSKYLKSYTAGWYVLSTTHLHEFKSADKAQAPVMSLYLPEQKLGSHSSAEGSSNKFILKGRQTGTMHRGHTWVFRAETHDTMMAWYEDIKALTEKSPEERSQFVRTHSRSLSRSSRRSVSSDGLMDEDDEEPFSASSQIDVNPGPKQDAASRRSQPGGRFPSDIQVNAQRGLQAPQSPSSVSSGLHERHSDVEAVAVAGALPAGAVTNEDDIEGNDHHVGYGDTDRMPMQEMPSSARVANQEAEHDGVNPYTSEPLQQQQQQQIPQRQSSHLQDSGVFVAAVPAAYEYQAAEEKQLDDRDQRGASGYHHNDDHVFGQPTPISATDDRREPAGVYDNTRNTDVNVVAATTGGFPRSDSTQETKLQTAGPSSNVVVPTMTSQPVDDAAAATRPTNNTNRLNSSNTVSNLHIPGEYPKANVAGQP